MTSAKVSDEAWAWLTPGAGCSGSPRRTASRPSSRADPGMDSLGARRVFIRHEQSWREGLWNRSDRCGAGNRGGGGSRNDSFADPSGCDRPGRRRMAHLLLDRRPATRNVIDRLPLEEGADPRPRWSRFAVELDGLTDAARLRRNRLPPAALTILAASVRASDSCANSMRISLKRSPR